MNYFIGEDYCYRGDTKKEPFKLELVADNGFAYQFRRRNGKIHRVTDNVFIDMVLVKPKQLALFEK